MRQGKQDILSALRQVAGEQVERSGRNAPAWLRSPLNNATLIPLSLYQGRLDEFRQLLVECKEDLQCFYDQAEQLSST
jgi:predicted aminopeptidase